MVLIDKPCFVARQDFWQGWCVCREGECKTWEDRGDTACRDCPSSFDDEEETPPIVPVDHVARGKAQDKVREGLYHPEQSRLSRRAVLSDPVRLAILRVLMADVDSGPRVMSVKELRKEIDQSPTNLYRHIKHLEAHNLITVAERRLVSGILEQRYRTSQLRLHWDSSLLADRTTSGNTSTMIAATFDQFRNDHVAGIRSGGIRFGQDLPSELSYLSPILAMSDHRVPAARASDLRNRLAALIDEFVDAEQDDDGIPIRVMVAYFSPADQFVHDNRDTVAPSDSSSR